MALRQKQMRSATEVVISALENIKLATSRQLEKALRTLNRQFSQPINHRYCFVV